MTWGPAKASGSNRSMRVAGSLAILFGVIGVLIGLAAAATFIPYREEEPWNQYAELMTAIAALGAVASVLGVVAGLGLRRRRSWAWGVAIGVAAVSVALVTFLAALAPFFWGFVAVVAMAYGVQVALLLLGRGSFRVRRAVPPAA